MDKCDHEYFFELGSELFKQVSVKQDHTNCYISSTQYDDLGIIRKVEKHTMPVLEIVEMIEFRWGMEIITRSGEKLKI